METPRVKIETTVCDDKTLLAPGFAFPKVSGLLAGKEQDIYPAAFRGCKREPAVQARPERTDAGLLWALLDGPWTADLAQAGGFEHPFSLYVSRRRENVSRDPLHGEVAYGLGGCVLQARAVQIKVQRPDGMHPFRDGDGGGRDGEDFAGEFDLELDIMVGRK